MLTNTDTTQIQEDAALVTKALKAWNAHVQAYKRGRTDNQTIGAHLALAAFERLMLIITLQQKKMQLD